MLALCAASFRVAGRLILDGVDLQVVPGRVTVLIGPNGAGKSTALALLAGDLAPGRGTATLDGQSLQAMTAMAAARRRAVMRQGTVMAFAFLVRDVVAMGRTPHAADGRPDHDRRIVAAAVEAADIGHLLDRPVTNLSGGERQRVHFARTLAQVMGQDGAYLLLDEPTSSLDLRHQHDLLARARRAAGEGLGVLAVLHDLNHAAAYGDDVVVLDGGRVAASGPVARVMQPSVLSPVFKLPLRLVAQGEDAAPILVADRAA